MKKQDNNIENPREEIKGAIPKKAKLLKIVIKGN